MPEIPPPQKAGLGSQRTFTLLAQSTSVGLLIIKLKKKQTQTNTQRDETLPM